jgi:catechol 2,3-dioxygenase-like lactoylglutathione lyase family enzyme
MGKIFLIITLLLIGLVNISAQAPWATLKEPPVGFADAGEVLRPGHLGRQIGNTELMIHFYHDLIGLELLGPRERARPFGSKETGPALLEFVQLATGVPDPMEARNRAVIMSIPGTSASKGLEMAIEAIEIKNIPSKPYKPLMSDPGASFITFMVKDLDKTLATLKDELTPIVTKGGKPVVLSDHPGISGKIRVIMVRDPDGYPVALMEMQPPSASSAPAESNILGARISIVVDKLETTCRWFKNLVPELQFWQNPKWMADKAYSDLTNMPGQFRMAMTMIPGSPVAMEFIEYKDHRKNYSRPHIQDPGSAHILFMSKDVDVITPRMKAAGIKTIGGTNAPVFIGPTTRSFFITDPDGFWAEFMDNGVKNKP